MDLLLFIIVAGSTLLGLAVGSFVAARAVRTAKELPVHLMGRSECLSCGKKLGWRDLVPVFSYTFLRGRCRQCKQPISPVYTAVELILAVGFGVLVWAGLVMGIFPFPLDTPGTGTFLGMAGLTLLIFSAAVFVSAVDLMIMAFPVRFLGFLAVITFLSCLLYGYPVPWLDAVYGGLAFSGAIALIRIVGKLVRGIEVMGEGDVWFAGLLGISLGLQDSIVAFYAAFLLGAIVALILIRVKGRGTAMLPFAPFLAMGWYVAFLFGSPLFQLLFPF